MNRYYFLLLGILALASCNKFLDVKPQSEISKDELFKTEEGFQEALNGVYTRCVKEDVYGNELTYGLLEVLGQNYSIESNQGPDSYKKIVDFKYDNNEFKGKKDNIWKGLYNGIVNANLILENIDLNKNLFTSNNYGIIKGEALALRAYLHFDAFRLFGSSLSAGAPFTGIPYVTTYSNKATAVSDGQEVLRRIIADLTEAKTLLSTTDSILSPRYKVGYPNITASNPLYTDFKGTETTGDVLFYQNRRHHMNYYAVCAELARVYLYQNDKDNALLNAKLVIQSAKFPFTSNAYFLNTNVKLTDHILYPELIFGWFAPKLVDATTNRFQNGTSGFVLNKTAGDGIYESAGPGAEDVRYKQWFQFGTSNAYYQVQKYSRNLDAKEDDETANVHPLMMPAIGLSEMYYIAAESIYDKDPSAAHGYLNAVRSQRGISDPVITTSKAEFMTELVLEARKQLYGEGQIFYMYKRLNRAIVTRSGGLVAPSRSVFVLPYPNDEIEFGGR